MFDIISKPDTHEKLKILTEDAQYDLACACSTDKNEHRKRNEDGKWIYPVTLPNGGKTLLFKTLISNVCSSDCKYCPLRSQMDIRRCTLTPQETANIFLGYYNRKKVFGLFLSSSIISSPDATMDRLNTTAKILRKKHDFNGFIHLKIIPGSSPAAIEEAVSLANTVSLNIETPGEKRLAKLSSKKNYLRDIIEPMKLINRLTAKGSKYQRTKQTTQFIVGAADETDSEIVKYMAGLYNRLGLNRIYFSAYQKGLGDESLPGENVKPSTSTDILTREHRLYQVDFLLRRYGFGESDIIFEDKDNLSLTVDPKEIWARNHPEKFPVNVNYAPRLSLLKVPGLGPITVNRILKRRQHRNLRSIEDIGKPTALLKKADGYLVF
ncbi:MAG: radical SAM protein [Planctomycetota bacterium]|jgi:predicted DNA-binding helix-hairpin-helix protein